MELNPVEKWFVNSPVRRRMRERSVGRLAGKAPGIPPSPRVLELGCGEGAAVSAIMRELNPAVYDATDLDERQIERARRRLSGRYPSLNIGSGSATAIAQESASYDAVFQFQVFHHIPNWRTALGEVHRVLKPGGYFIFTETPIEFFTRTPFGLLLRAVTDHPYDLMFSAQEFRSLIEGLRFEVLYWQRLRSGSFEGVARKAVSRVRSPSS